MKRRDFSKLLAVSALTSFVTPIAGRGALVNKLADELKNGEYNWFPERSPDGPILAIVSIPDQKVHVYRNGIRICASTCSTGKPGHATPTGVFKILQKDKDHKSSTYNDAPMPNMNRLTWSGIALHAGNLPGYPASHGCVRLPMGFSELLFGVTKLGMTVIIADETSHPSTIVHPGMVLGDYAQKEFAAVDLSIKRHAYTEGHVDIPTVTSVVVSRQDQKVIVWENGKIVASGFADIEDQGLPLGSRVFTLVKTNDKSDELTWVYADFSEGREKADAAETIRRIKARPEIRAEIRKRMHQGMTLVTTDGWSRTKYRTKDDFMVMDGLF